MGSVQVIERMVRPERFELPTFWFVAKILPASPFVFLFTALVPLRHVHENTPIRGRPHCTLLKDLYPYSRTQSGQKADRSLPLPVANWSRRGLSDLPVFQTLPARPGRIVEAFEGRFSAARRSSRSNLLHPKRCNPKASLETSEFAGVCLAW